MSTTLKIVLLNLIILAAQAFYMYLSSRTQMKSKRYMYIIAAPIVMAFPAILNYQDADAYNIYVYAIVICIITVAVMDVAYATAYNRDFMNDERFCGLLYAYLMICAASGWLGKTNLIISLITIILLIGAVFLCGIIIRPSLRELFRAVGTSMFSMLCAWAFLNYVQ